MSVTIYHNPKCSKSRETLALLQDQGIAATVVEYLKAPPSIAELTRILGFLGKPAKDLLRKKDAAEAGVDPALPEADLIAAMVAHPAVIERPIVVTETQARIGRPPESVLEIL